MIQCPHCKASQAHLYPYRLNGNQIVACLLCGWHIERGVRRRRGETNSWDGVRESLDAAYFKMDVFTVMQLAQSSGKTESTARNFLDEKIVAGELTRIKGQRGAWVYCKPQQRETANG